MLRASFDPFFKKKKKKDICSLNRVGKYFHRSVHDKKKKKKKGGGGPVVVGKSVCGAGGV